MERLRARARGVFVVISVVLGAVVASPGFAAPPQNDDFSAALEIGLPHSASVDVTEASLEYGEPRCYYYFDQDSYSTVWYRFTATSDARIVASTFSSSIGTSVGVFTGSALKELTATGCRGSSPGYRARVAWKPVVGETYFIRIGGADQGRGVIDFSVDAPAAPSHDTRAEAMVVPYAEPIEFEHLSEENGGANSAGEPAPSCMPWLGNDSATVWYKLTTPATVGADLIYHPLGYYPYLAAWEERLDLSLTEIGCSYFRPVRLTPKPNTSYYFQLIDPYYQGAPMGIHLHPPLVNDNFDEAIEVPSLPFTHSGDAYNATVEAGERKPSCANLSGVGSIWYTYTAASDTVIQLNTRGSNDAAGTNGLASWVAAYTGTGLSSLRELGCSAPTYSPPLTLELRAGETIHIQTGYTYSGHSFLEFSAGEQAPAANDTPETARALSDSRLVDTTASQSTSNARHSAGEQAASCGGGDLGSTVWFSLTAPLAGPFTLDTSGSTYDTVLAVYDGGAEIACNDDTGGKTPSKVGFQAEAGRTYFISVSGNDRRRGSLSLRLSSAAIQANDSFASATAIGAIPFADTPSTWAATLEPGEPQPSAKCISGTNPNTIGFTVWYRHTPTEDTTLSASVLGNNLQTMVTVYSGSTLTSLAEVACTKPGEPVNPAVTNPRIQVATFEAKAGTTYYFQVGHRATAGSRAVPFQLTRVGGGSL